MRCWKNLNSKKINKNLYFLYYNLPKKKYSHFPTISHFTEKKTFNGMLKTFKMRFLTKCTLLNNCLGFYENASQGYFFNPTEKEESKQQTKK